MEKLEIGTKVKINITDEICKNLGINVANSPNGKTGIIDGHYKNGVAGHYIKVNSKTVAIADKYECLEVVD